MPGTPGGGDLPDDRVGQPAAPSSGHPPSSEEGVDGVAHREKCDKKCDETCAEKYDDKCDEKCDEKCDASRPQSRDTSTTATAAGPSDLGRLPEPPPPRRRPSGEAIERVLSRHRSLGADNPIEHLPQPVRRPRGVSSAAPRAPRGAVGRRAEEPDEGDDEEYEDDDHDEVYDRFAPRRKMAVVVLLSFCSFLAPISSTSVLAATPEIAAEYDTTGSIVDVANAMYMLMMGISPIVWGPLSQVYGRRVVSQITAVLFFGCSIGTALAPNLAAFFLFRILTAFEGTAFILVGSACLSDIYRPTERATAMGWFLSGTLIGPAFGPFVGGIIVTYRSWRVIFWLQSALSGVAVLGTFLLLPETIHRRRIDDLRGYSARRKARVLWALINPVRVLRLYRYPNLVMAGLASSAIIWNMYSLLTPIRYVLNPRFHLTSPMQGGLFYLAPGCGYLVGTFGGGRYADYVVRRWMGRRGGRRVPEDRMRSAVPFMGAVIPACMLVYGWSVEKGVGGVALPVVTLFLQGVAQLFCFPSLNTYCLDVMRDRGAEVIAGNYFVRYLFACAATACVLPAVEALGVGWFTTISAAFLLVATAGTVAAIWWGEGWREAVDRKRRARQRAARERGVEDDEEEEEGEEEEEEEKKASRGGRGGDEGAAEAEDGEEQTRVIEGERDVEKGDEREEKKREAMDRSGRATA